MENTSKRELKRRDRAYYRRRQQNRVFAALTSLFAEEVAKGSITKKDLAEILGRDPSQITRWLSAPSNFELDTISDILLAMGAEMDVRLVRFADRPKLNFAHPMIARYFNPSAQITVRVGEGVRVRSPTSATAETAIAIRPS